jgi:selenide,water dikinase
MARASGADVEVAWERVPVLAPASELGAAGAVPGGTRDNLEWVADAVDWLGSVPPLARLLLSDAQTSGGLLLAVDGAQGEALAAALRRAGVAEAAVIGRFTGRGPGRIAVR